ncbi:MAG: hypothetical protein ACRERC_24075 [Candidatus Binatia bacterium]
MESADQKIATSADGACPRQGERDDERRAHEFLASHTFAELPDEVHRLGETWRLCERCVDTGDAIGADALYRRLTDFVATGAAGFWSGDAGHYLGLLAMTLARWDAAAAHFEDALRASAASGAVMQARRTQFAYLRLLLARATPGDEVKAEHLLAELIAGLHVVRLPGAAPDVDGALAARPPRRYAFRCEGDYWTLAWEGRVARLRTMRGFHYLAELLRHPHQQIYVVDLIGQGSAAEARLSGEEASEHGLRTVGTSDAGAPLDRRARDDYRARWQELIAEEAVALHDNDVGRLTRAQAEIDMLAAQLSAATGRRGARGTSSFQERARVNVRNCITAALRAIRRHDEPLWRHLFNSIRTGAFCCYDPDQVVGWEM